MRKFTKKKLEPRSKSNLKRKQYFYKINLEHKIKKPKELWKTLKSMGLPSKAALLSNICLKDRNDIAFNDTKKCSIFERFKHIEGSWY